MPRLRTATRPTVLGRLIVLFELIVIALCIILIVLLLVARRRYSEMDDHQVLCFTRARAVLLKENVKPKDAARFSREHLILFHAILYLFLVVGVALTVVSMYYVTRSHLSYLPYVRVTSRQIILDTKLVLAVGMIVAYWALFIVYFYAGRSMTRRESLAVERSGGALAECEESSVEPEAEGDTPQDTAE